MSENVVIRASEVSLNEGLLRLAAAHNAEVSFRYAKGEAGAVIEQRTLVPAGVKTVGDHVTFTGYDPDRDGPRAYRTDRIKGQVSV
jgi:predicted DNA-binding transcriptional regulator YafY